MLTRILSHIRHTPVAAKLLRGRLRLYVALLLACSSVFAQASIVEVRALAERGAMTEAVALALSLRTEAAARDDALAEAAALRELANLYEKIRAPDLALRAANAGLRLVPRSPATELRGLLLLEKTRAHIRLGQFEDAHDRARDVLAIGDRIGDAYLYASGTYMLASALNRTGQADEAEVLYLRATTLLLEAGFLHDYARALNDLAMNYKLRGQFDEALRLFEQLIAFAEPRGDTHMVVYGLLELGDINRLRGQFDVAEAYLQRSLQESSTAGDVDWLIFTHSYLKDLYLATGETAMALYHTNALAIQQGVKRAESAATRIAQLEYHQSAAESAHRMQLLEKEREIAELALKRTRSTVVALLLGVGLLALSATVWYRRYRTQQAANDRLAASNRALDYAASTDALTGLANRRALGQHLQRLAAQRNGYALILMDLDWFKRINDEYGHDHGDAVLVEVADRIRSRLRRTDFAVRWGGEEFLVLLAAAGREDAHDIAQQLQEHVRRAPIVVDNIAHRVTATFGIATANRHGDFEQTLKDADQALAAGKQAGRDNIAFTDYSATGTNKAINLVA